MPTWRVSFWEMLTLRKPNSRELSSMEQTGARRGVASLCIGGGEATAMAVERMG